MELIYWYVLFAVTTSVTALYELFVPVMRELESKKKRPSVLDYKWVAYLTLFTFTLLIAPAMLVICVVPSLGNVFRNTLTESLTEI
jgi:hypothetical protein